MSDVMETVDGLPLDDKQRMAVVACTDRARRVCGVTGAAGSGKTTIIHTVTNALTEAGYSVALAAPTGKAAKRIKEATGIPAQTFHRLLEFTSPGDPDPKTGKPIWVSYPQRSRKRPLEHDVIIGDEYAMVNKELHADVVGAIKSGGRLLTFGDANQLQPIEQTALAAKTPSKFLEILDKFDGITLDTIHRTGAGSSIADNGRRVLRGMAPVKHDDFTLDYTNQPVQSVLAYLKGKEDEFRETNAQIITPTNVSWVGQYKLNVAIQSQLQPHRTGWLELARHEWDAKQPVRVHVGDKVVVTKNLYSINCNDGTAGVFNGETGIIRAISQWAEIEVDLGDRVCVLPPQMLIEVGGQVRTIYPHRELALAYALTTHKCQGSEYAHVVYVQNKSQLAMLCRPNLYTGITRARSRVHVVSDMAAMARACSATQSALDMQRR
jgi:exodeoxyribonuclease V alpha subunit